MSPIENRYAAAGSELDQSKHALIIIHGRGASAEGILPLSDELNLPEATAVLAPRADHNSWYPASFIAPVEVNQPSLDSAITLINELVTHVVASGIPKSNIYFLGFSQGACLALEYVCRNASRYAGVVAFTGGLIGEVLQLENYRGDFEQTPVLISTSNPDHHVPLKRVKESGSQLEAMNARVTVVGYPGKPHNITAEEIELAVNVIFKPAG